MLHKPTTAQRCRSETEKFILDDIFSSVLSKLKKYHPSANLKFNNLGIFQSLKLSNLMGKTLRFSLELNFTTNTFGCYGLSYVARSVTSLTDVFPDAMKTFS